MILSKSLLYEGESKDKIFKTSLEKAKALLTEVFDLDFNNPDPKILNIIDQPENCKFEILFDIKGRKIAAFFNLENVHNNILSEVLRIKETIINHVQILDATDSYIDAVNKTMDYIEKKYDIDFTPLDPEEENKNIIKTNYVKDESWLAVFTSEDYEAEFKAEYKYSQGKAAILTVTQYRDHISYLE